MSLVDTYRRNITRKRETLSKLASERAKESTKIANGKKKIDTARQAINRTKSQSVISNRLKEIGRAEKENTDAYKKIAIIDGKMSKLEKEISDDQKRLDREQEKEQANRLKKEVEVQRKAQRQIESMSKTIKTYENQQFEMQGQIEAMKRAPERITVLFLAANPKNTNSLRLDEEAREIQEKIRKSEFRDTIIFESRWAVRTMDIIQAINEVDPDIIHFSGHGDENGELVFEDTYGNAKLVTKDAMTQTISTVSDKIRFIFFNACFSAEQAKSIVGHINAAIGMNKPIGDKAAITFAAQFYSSIGFGKSIKTAYEQAKASLMLEGINEEDTPELYVKSELSSDEIYLVQPG